MGIFCFRRSHTLSGSARKALSCLHGGLFEVKTPWRELFVITQCWIDVSFQNDLFTWPPAVRFSDGLSGSARNTSNVFECRNKGNATTTINKYGHSFRHLSCYVRLHFLNSPPPQQIFWNILQCLCQKWTWTLSNLILALKISVQCLLLWGEITECTGSLKCKPI